MHPIVWVIPLLLMIGGVLMLGFLPLSLPLRALISIAEILAAVLVGFLLWQKTSR